MKIRLFVIVFCLACVPLSAQRIKTKPVVTQRINLRHQSFIGNQSGLGVEFKQKVLTNINSSPSEKVIKEVEQKQKKLRQITQMWKEYEVPLLPPFEDVKKRKQLFDSAFISLSMADTLSYIKYLKRSVSAHYPVAIYAYGLSILDGVGVKSNKDIGLSYIKKASDSGCPDATCFIAELYESGDYGYKKDSIMALNYYEKSAEQGGFVGAAISGDIYYDKSDTVKAIRYWKKAYELKAHTSLIKSEKELLGRIACLLGYFSNIGCYMPQNQQVSLDYMRYSAELGNSYGEAWYGYYCYNGYGMDKDQEKAIYWYKQAALQNDVDAMCALPKLYFDAQDNDSTIFWGTKKECCDSADIQYYVGAAYYNKDDYKNAESWWKKAALQNDVDALWWMYLLNTAIKQDSVAAFEYLEKAVEAKYPDALNEMGCNYADGYVVEKDLEKSKELFREAASMGCKEAYNNLGNLYSYKDYIKRPNWEIAVDFFRQGAELGSVESQYAFALCLKKGRGVKKDKQSAKYWLIKAAQNGHEGAKRDLKKMGVDFSKMDVPIKQKNEGTDSEAQY